MRNLFLFALVFATLSIISCKKVSDGPRLELGIVSHTPDTDEEDVYKHTPITVTFSDVVEREALWEHIEIYDRTNDTWLSLNSTGLSAISTPPEPRESFTLWKNLTKRDSEIEVRFKQGLPSTNGAILASDYLFVYHTASDSIPLAIYDVWPEANTVLPRLGYEVAFSFSDVVTLDSTQVVVTPSYPDYHLLTVAIDANYRATSPYSASNISTYIVLWTDSLLADTTYQIRISGDVNDYEGDKLGEDVVLSYEVED